MNINIGEMQKEAQFVGRTGQAERRFATACSTWSATWTGSWLAYEYVAQNAGSKTVAGCNGIDVMGFYENEMGNIQTTLRISSSRVLLKPVRVRRVKHPHAERQDASVGHPRWLLHTAPLFASDLGEMISWAVYTTARNEERKQARRAASFPTDSRCQDTAFSSLRRAVFPLLPNRLPILSNDFRRQLDPLTDHAGPTLDAVEPDPSCTRRRSSRC